MLVRSSIRLSLAAVDLRDADQGPVGFAVHLEDRHQSAVLRDLAPCEGDPGSGHHERAFQRVSIDARERDLAVRRQVGRVKLAVQRPGEAGGLRLASARLGHRKVGSSVPNPDLVASVLRRAAVLIEAQLRQQDPDALEVVSSHPSGLSQRPKGSSRSGRMPQVPVKSLTRVDDHGVRAGELEGEGRLRKMFCGHRWCGTMRHP